MAFMTWNEQFTTGIAIVDQQHHGLVDLVNQAAPTLAAASRENLHDVEPLIDALMDYAAIHFRTEETLMENYGVDRRHFEHHRQSHAAFVRHVRIISRSLLTGNAVTGDELLTFLANWLIFHILGEDQAMVRQINAIGSGQTPARAFEEGGAQRDPAQNALTRSLVDLYTLLTQQNRDLLEANNRLQRTQAELSLNKQHLEELVHERTAQLEAANAELTQARDAAEMASRAKSTFLATISHEIRTPMNAIVSFAYLLERANLAPRMKDYARLINESAQKLLSIVNDILEFSRIESGGVRFHQQDFEISALLKVIYADLRVKGMIRKLEVIQELDPELPRWLRGDPLLLEQILRQLANNAVKFTDQGSIIFRARVEEFNAGDLKVRFEIEDTGIGIHPDQQAKLFEVFEQGDSSLTRRYGGIGLGLAIANRLAQIMGGALGVESQSGAGSRFWITLRLDRLVDNPVESLELQDGETEPASSMTITKWLDQLEGLLADDDLRASQVFAEGTSLWRQALGEHAEEFAEQMEIYQYQDALRTLRAVRSA